VVLNHSFHCSAHLNPPLGPHLLFPGWSQSSHNCPTASTPAHYHTVTSHLKIKICAVGVMTHTYSTLEAGAGGSLVEGQPRLHR
jgi:hypothetical protein